METSVYLVVFLALSCSTASATTVSPPATTVSPLGTTVSPPGTTVVPPGTTISPLGTTVSPPGTTVVPPGTTISPLGTTVSPPGTTVVPPGTTISPLATTVSPPGTTVSPPGTKVSPPGSTVLPPGTTVSPPGTTVTPPVTSTIQTTPVTSGPTPTTRHTPSLPTPATTQQTTAAQVSVRLVDGSVPYEGRVELLINNTWGTLCGYYWQDNTARVLCRQLGYSFGSETRVVNGFFGNPSSSQWTLPLYFTCTGFESNIQSCSRHDGNSYACSNRYHAGVVCRSQVHPPMQVRLMDGRTSVHGVEGRVEVSINGAWGTICDDSFERNAARIICTMLGYSSGISSPMYNSLYGTGSGPVLISRLLCQNSDTNLTTCLQLSSSVSNCTSAQVAGVICNYTRTREDIPVRLVGPSSYEGNVELFVNNKWRRLCVNGIDQNLATVVCRQLGLPFSFDRVVSKGYYINRLTPLSNRVYMQYSCSGIEHRIDNCTIYQPLGSQSCVYKNEFGVSCHPDTTENREVTTGKSLVPASSVGDNKSELNIAAVILGVTLALALIANILILVFFMKRDCHKGTPYIAETNRGGQEEARQNRGDEAMYINAAFHSNADAPAHMAPTPTVEKGHFYEPLQNNAPRK